MEVSGQHQAPAALLPIKNSGTNGIERWVGPGPVWTLAGIRICPTRRYSSTYLITTSRSPAFPSAPARALQRREFFCYIDLWRRFIRNECRPLRGVVIVFVRVETESVSIH
jgi:hypothetical protein